MPGSLAWAKRAALEAYVTFWGRDSRRVRADDARGKARCSPGDDRRHIEAALAWLGEAQDTGGDDGVAAMYSFVEGWVASYPETTGYIIPTLFDAAEALQIGEPAERAIRMADWLLTQQQADGAFPGLFADSSGPPRVFNTGQIIFGLVRTAAETGKGVYLKSAERAGRWLLSRQDDDGAWRRDTLGNIPHTYNVRTAWALVQLAESTGEDRYCDAALANADWALTQQCASGWFRNNSFDGSTETATLHTIAYAMRGLLEIGAATDTVTYVNAARRAADALLAAWYAKHSLKGAFPINWRSPVPWRCLPGEAQLAIVWLRLDQILGQQAYRRAALSLLEGVKAMQFINEEVRNVHGGISGSMPINGDYERYCLVNWGPKFLIDGLLLKAQSEPRAENRECSHREGAGLPALSQV